MVSVATTFAVTFVNRVLRRSMLLASMALVAPPKREPNPTMNARPVHATAWVCVLPDTPRKIDF